MMKKVKKIVINTLNIKKLFQDKNDFDCELLNENNFLCEKRRDKGEYNSIQMKIRREFVQLCIVLILLIGHSKKTLENILELVRALSITGN